GAERARSIRPRASRHRIPSSPRGLCRGRSGRACSRSEATAALCAARYLVRRRSWSCCTCEVELRLRGGWCSDEEVGLLQRVLALPVSVHWMGVDATLATAVPRSMARAAPRSDGVLKTARGALPI